MEGRPIRETVLLYGLGTLWGILDSNMSESAHVRDRQTPHIHPDPFLPCLRGGVTGQPKSTLLCRPCSRTRWCHYALAGGEGRASTFASRVTWHRADENPTKRETKEKGVGSVVGSTPPQRETSCRLIHTTPAWGPQYTANPRSAQTRPGRAVLLSNKLVIIMMLRW